MFGEFELSSSGVVVSGTTSAKPMLSFQNFSVRCDTSDPKISFIHSWNWDVIQGKKLSLITTNPYLRYQLISCLAGLVSPVTGEAIPHGVISWPVGEQGGLDGKLRVSHAIDFLSIIYGDCLAFSRVSVDEFWDLLSGVNIRGDFLIKELSKLQKEFFYLSLSALFSFDCYLVYKTKFLESKPAKSLRSLLLRQLEGKTLITTSANNSFRSEFCTEGLVLSSRGELLFEGELREAIKWSRCNLKKSEDSVSDRDDAEMGDWLKNDENSADLNDEF